MGEKKESIVLIGVVFFCADLGPNWAMLANSFLPHYLVDLSLIHILFTDFFHIKSYATQKISP
ncbi:hypothetical protein AB4257_24825, partial [Vibrio splendidus]